jgi:5-amino-6-(5-phospho-D-ribitylamino)uracil phosphatase
VRAQQGAGPLWRPKWVAVDIDGTLVRDGHAPSPRVREAIARTIGLGVHIVLATGRPPMEIQPIIEALQLPPGLAVCSNGAVTAVFPPVKIQRMVAFDPKPTVYKVVAQAPQVRVGIEDLQRGYLVSSLFPPDEMDSEQTIMPLSELVAQPVSRVLLRDLSQTPQQLIRLLDLLQLTGMRYAEAHKPWIDLTVDGVSKGSALAEIGRELGLPKANCLAIGDGPHDIPMLLWAARGVAMGQSPAKVQQAADYVTGRVDQEGLAEELERWFG